MPIGDATVGLLMALSVPSTDALYQSVASPHDYSACDLSGTTVVRVMAGGGLPIHCTVGALGG